MRRKDAPSHLRLRRPQETEPQETSASEAFLAQTFLYVDEVYADAVCLTGSAEEAADLVVEAYTRAFREYERAAGGCGSARPEPHDTLTWLYKNLYAAFCDGILGRRAVSETPIGEYL